MISSAPAPVINHHRCTGCGRCISACRSQLVSLDTHGWRKQARLTHQEKCVNCMSCFRECPLRIVHYTDSL